MKIVSTRQLFVFFLLAMIISGGCKKKDEEEKQPSADFATDKTEYLAGETIILTNKSTEAKTYRWTMPDGQTNKSKDVTYKIDDATGDQQLPIKLEVFSESGNKTDHIVKNVTVKRGNGLLVIYTAIGYSYYGLSIDGGQYQTIYISGDTIPECWQAGYVTYPLPSGFHVLSGTYANNSVFTSTVLVKPNGCTKFCIQ